MKDPAFLFYPNDWLGGTMTMTRHQKGCYIDLLMAQFNSGPLSIEQVKAVLGVDQASWTVLQEKFSIDASGRFFNERLAAEIDKRKKFCASRRANRENENKTYDKTYDKHMMSHMENRNENENENEKRKGVENQNFSALQPIDPDLMGFKGQVRLWLETEHGYIWSKQDDYPIQELEKKIRESQQRARLPAQKADLVFAFKKLIQNLDPWIAQKKFSLEYINKNFNEIRNNAKTAINGHKKGDPPLDREAEARLREMLKLIPGQ